MTSVELLFKRSFKDSSIKRVEYNSVDSKDFAVAIHSELQEFVPANAIALHNNCESYL